MSRPKLERVEREPRIPVPHLIRYVLPRPLSPVSLCLCGLMITQFAFRLIFGLSFVWCLMPRDKVTSGFFRIQNLVTLGLAVLAAVSAGQLLATLDGTNAILSAGHLQLIAVALGVCSFAGSIFWTLERRAGATRLALLLAALSAIAALLGSVSTEQLATWRGSLFAISELSIGAVSGSAVAGMLLGHWYLTAPTMSTSPLNRVNAFLGVAAAIRLVLSGIGLMLFSQTSNAANGIWSSTYSVWLSLDWLGGSAGQLVVSAMVWRIMKYRNTQAATGVLFVGVILAFLGEMTAALLRRELNLPL